MSAGRSVMGFLRGVTPGWKLASSLAIGTMAILAVLVAARFQFRAEQGVYSFSFGRPLPVATPVKDSAARIESLRAELTGLLQATSRAERVEWMNALQREMKESNRYNSRQQKQWNAALAKLETRLNERMEDNAVTLTAGMHQFCKQCISGVAAPTPAGLGADTNPAGGPRDPRRTEGSGNGANLVDAIASGAIAGEVERSCALPMATYH